MKKKIVLLIILIIPILGFSQKTVEFTAGLGYTSVNIDELVNKDEIDGSWATDWNTMNYGFSGQFFFASLNNMSFGAEAMYQRLYWYSVRVPYGISDIYREYTVSAGRVTPIVRFGINNKFSADFGPEFNFIGGGMALGLMLSSNYSIPISDKIEIPLKLRLDIMKKIVFTMPISFNFGVRIKL